MTNLKNTTALQIARARVRAEVLDYFRALGGHGAINAEEIANGELDAVDHAAAILATAGERGIDLGARHDLDAETLREALESECADVIEQSILDYEASVRIYWKPLTDAERVEFIELLRTVSEAGLMPHIELLEESLEQSREAGDDEQIDAIEDRLAVLEGELYARAAVA